MPPNIYVATHTRAHKSVKTQLVIATNYWYGRKAPACMTENYTRQNCCNKICMHACTMLLYVQFMGNKPSKSRMVIITCTSNWLNLPFVCMRHWSSRHQLSENRHGVALKIVRAEWNEIPQLVTELVSASRHVRLCHFIASRSQTCFRHHNGSGHVYSLPLSSVSSRLEVRTGGSTILLLSHNS